MRPVKRFILNDSEQSRRKPQDSSRESGSIRTTVVRDFSHAAQLGGVLVVLVLLLGANGAGAMLHVGRGATWRALRGTSYALGLRGKCE